MGKARQIFITEKGKAVVALMEAGVPREQVLEIVEKKMNLELIGVNATLYNSPAKRR